MKCLECNAYLPNGYEVCPCGGNTDTCRHIGECVSRIKTVCKEIVITQKTNACDIHSRCLPSYNPTGDQLTKWLERPESRLYHLCHGCESFEPKSLASYTSV